MFSIKTKQSNPNIYDKIKKNIKDLESKKVVAGFPKGNLNTPHYEDGASIVDVAIWNNFGIGVPKRDFMTPSSKKWGEFITQKIEELGEDLPLGKIDSMSFLDAMGQAGADLISDEIVALDTPPNSPRTIEKKGAGKSPLIDSGDLSKAPKWEIRNKEA